MTNWVREAAEEIWSGVFGPDDIIAIIEKHCPFKKDVAYREVTAHDALAASALEFLRELGSAHIKNSNEAGLETNK